jgi:predicted nucleic acid-binding protein
MFVEIVVDRPVILAMRAVDRMQIPDLPDRVIAATAVRFGIPLINRDRKIRDPNIESGDVLVKPDSSDSEEMSLSCP